MIRYILPLFAAPLLAAFLLALAVYIAMHRVKPAKIAFTNAAADRVVIPWQLNTRCTITSRNLPIRNPEETT